MATLHIPGVKITGMAAVVPQQVVYNKDYDNISEKDRASLIETTGISERRFCKPGVCMSDISVSGAEKLIEGLSWDKKDIELLVFVSQSRDYILPNTACLIQDRLGLSKKCMAFDVPLGCSGYIYGLSIMASLMMTGTIKKGLLIAGDVCSPDLSKNDKSVYPLFGDASSVTAMEYTGNSKDIMEFDMQTDGAGYEAIIIPDGGMRNQINFDSFEFKEYGVGIIRSKKNVFLDGMKVFEFSIREVAKNIKGLLATISKTVDDYDYFVFHQANLLMNETIRKQLKIAPEKVPYSLHKFGNTSSASIPLTIVTQLGAIAAGQRKNYLLSGFGVGLSWGAATVAIDHIVCLPIIEYID